MSSRASTVGIIANPAAGKDIRRLVAQGRFVSNQEKVNILRRVLAGLDSVGVKRVLFMPDLAGLGRGATDGQAHNIDIEFLDSFVTNKEIDSTRAAQEMKDRGVGCIVTLGGDGTNRAVAKTSGDVPLVPISTGTNNVFPQMIEGTVAGIAAGVVATGRLDPDSVTRRSTVLEIYVEGAVRDIALIDIAISAHQFVGARALWDIGTVHELFLARTEADSIGLSSIGARLRPSNDDDRSAVHIELGEGGIMVAAPIAPGIVTTVPVTDWNVIEVGESASVSLTPCTVALDGERTFSIKPGESSLVTLRDDGPPVVVIEKALREATRLGVFATNS